MTVADEPPIHVRHLLLCEAVEYNPDKPGAAFSLRGLVVSLRPPDDFGYPFCVENIVLFAQLFGEPGRHSLTVELYRIDDEAAGGESRVAGYGWKTVRVREGQFVEGIRFPLPQVPFPTPGVYEFRLMLEGHPEPLAAERLRLEA